MTQLQQLAILLADAAIRFQDLIEEAVFVILRERLGVLGRQTDGDRHLASVTRGRNDELCTLAGGERERHDRIGIGDALAGVALVHHRRAELPGPLEGQARHVHPLPPRPGFQVQLTGTVDADFRHFRRGHVLGDAQHFVLIAQEIAGDEGEGDTSASMFVRWVTGGVQHVGEVDVLGDVDVHDRALVDGDGRRTTVAAESLIGQALHRACGSTLIGRLHRHAIVGDGRRLGPCSAAAYLKASEIRLIISADAIRLPQCALYWPG